ncbi:phosphoglycerate dehydrogenase [Leifsonia bigeumensis]|uniref:Phosphoglycerate dehydrogenase n=1 Tax=Leifsonella bigeumensis TaxID=433643 RepID=A0ABP7FHQ3_9MICO
MERLLREAGFEVRFSSEVLRRGTEWTVHEHIPQTDALILGTEPLTASDLAAIDGLEIVARTGAGYDNVDIAAADVNGIAVCNTPGANRQSVVELTIGLLLNLARDLPANINATARAEWPQNSGSELSGSVLGILGVGAIGRSVAQSARALGMSVIGHDPWVGADDMAAVGVEAVTLDELLCRADYVSLHIALTEETRNLIDRSAFRRMKNSAFLVNTSRGGIVNERDLISALQDGEIAGAALDVIEREPVTSADPLLTAPNLLLTAHIAGATNQARQRSAEIAVQQIVDFFAGRVPAHQVNLSKVTE